MWPMLAVLALPLVEIALFVTLGGAIGLGATMLEILGTAALGIFLLRRQGVEMQQALRMPRQIDPLKPLAEGAVISIAAGMLILPGFLTDTMGALLLVPPVRRALIGRIGRRVQVHTAGWPPRRPNEPTIIEADYVEVDPEPRDPLAPPRSGGNSGWTRH